MVTVVSAHLKMKIIFIMEIMEHHDDIFSFFKFYNKALIY